MKSSLSLITLILLAVSANAQHASTSDAFHWDSHKWQELSWKQSISRRHLPPAQKAELIKILIEQIRGSDSDHPRSGEQARRTAEETRIAFVDLTGRGRNEVIAQAGGEESDCSPTGNCPLWVLRHERDGYRVILDAGSVQTFTIQPTRTHGYNDLVLGMHGSAFEATLTLEEFDGSSYAGVACYDAIWEVIDENGKAHRLKEPRVSPCQ